MLGVPGILSCQKLNIIIRLLFYMNMNFICIDLDVISLLQDIHIFHTKVIIFLS
jgi:hypothetical protein